MVREDSFSHLMQGLRDGEPQAAVLVFNRFTQRLVQLARGQFDTWMRDRADPEGVVQSAYRSFFQRCRAGEFDLDDWHHLWALLTLITVRKCRNRVEYLRAATRDVSRERPLDALDDSLDREPTAVESALLTETVQRLLEAFEPPERVIVELSLQGYTVPEISADLGRSERTVRRVRQRIQELLQRMRAEEVQP